MRLFLLSGMLFFNFLHITAQTSAETQPSVSFPKGYWQQKVDYAMNIDMDVETYQYKGTQTLVYTNNSPEILDKVYYHLFFNAFQPTSEMNARLETVLDPDSRMVINKGDRKNPVFESRITTLQENEMGYINVQSLFQDNEELSYKVEGTVLEVVLNQAIKPNESTTFQMEFTGQVPVQIRRSGRNNREGIELSMAQWYPKMAEYDREGWHTDPYIGREFYGVWGNFDVNILIDKDFTVGGTGYLMNPQEVGHGYESQDLPLQIPKEKKLLWKFHAPKVHDFTWAADRDYIHDKQVTKEGITMHFLYQNDKKYIENWGKMQPLAVKTFEYYNDHIGKYPYEQYSVIQGGDGGMEYGMCTLVNGNSSFDGLLGTIIHEMGHAWFQFALATNENKHPWMDEGFTTYVENLAHHSVLNTPTDTFAFADIYGGYFYMVQTGQEEPLTTHSDRYQTNMSYSINAYYKGSVFMAQLGYVIGKENLEQTIKKYYELWGGKHPTPMDFIRVAEQVSGIELDWYYNEFGQTTHTIDYGVHKVENNQITLNRIGAMPMPIDVTVYYTDGSSDAFYIPLNLMRGEKPTDAKMLKDWGWGFPSYTFSVTKEVKKVILDPSFFMADIDRENNTWEHVK